MTGSVFVDACRFFPTAGGTTDWTFSSAVNGYQSPVSSGIVNGSLYSYRAESADLTQWEIGQGAYNTGTGVLARTTVLYNSSATGIGTGQSGAGTKISFNTVPQVGLVDLREDLLTANITKAIQQTGTDNVAGVTALHQQDHDSAVKVTAQIVQTAGTYTVASGYNVSGTVTKTATGVVSISFVVPFASASYAVLLTLNQITSLAIPATIQESLGSRTASSITVNISQAGVGTDLGFSVACFGRQ